MEKSKDIKILLVGDDTYDMYVKAFFHAFLQENYNNVRLFATNRCLDAHIAVERVFRKAENKLAFGPHIDILNWKLLQKAKDIKPDLIFLYSARLIKANTVKKLKETGAKIFMYNNDNPFAEYYPRYFWRHYNAGLQYADVGFVYRFSNVQSYKEKGCKRVEILRSYYIKEKNYPVEIPRVKVPKVVFLGHYENDDRGEYIKSLIENKIEVGVVRQGWENYEEGNKYLIKLDKGMELYNEMINAAEIAIVFLSKINHDTYTRRCFEIPATKTMMIAPYTEDIASMFQEDKEIVFYKNKEEFVQNIKYYLSHKEERQEIAEAGYKRLMQDGHEVKDRIEFIIDIFEQISEKNM